jgi:quinol-cytochrome oxidoreductase complex cytochrome b subunit
VAVLPAMTTVLLAVHVLLVQKHGMSVPLSMEGEKLKHMKFFPNFFLRDLIGWILAIGVLAALAAIFPWELGEKADPFAPAPAGIRPEWYFLFMFQTLKLIPAKILIFDGEVVGILAFALGGLFWLAVPLLDKPSRQSKRSFIFTAIGLIVVLYIIAMTVYGYLD